MSDYIKRADATAVISKTLGSLGNSVVTEINSLPGYVADRPTGRWVKKNYIPYCSECGRSSAFEENFCPNCGAKMEGGEEE